jgi:hypothetical protein
MISKPKILITLTVLRIVDGIGIHYSVTDGQATLQGTSSTFERLENDFLAVVKELIQGNPTYQKDYVNFTQGDWPERSVRFAIDSELVSVMINTYRENAEGADIVKLNEYFINLFDKVNGNTAVSCSVGIANLVKSIQAGEVDLGDTSIEETWLDKLTKAIFDTDPLDPEQQGLSFIQVTLKDNVKIDLHIVHAVGNVFVSGSIGTIGIRIYKTNVIQLFINLGAGFTDYATKLFSTGNKEQFVIGMRRLLSTQLS